MENKAKSPWDNQHAAKPASWGQGSAKPAWAVPPAQGVGKPPFSVPKATSDTPTRKHEHPLPETKTVPPSKQQSAPSQQDIPAIKPAQGQSAPAQQVSPQQSTASAVMPSRKGFLPFILLILTALLLLAGVAVLLISGKYSGNRSSAATTTGRLPDTASAKATTEVSAPTVQTRPVADTEPIITQPNTTPPALLDPTQYLGEWKPGLGDGYTSITIHSLDEEYAVFDLWFYRLAFFECVGGPISGNTVTFSTHGSSEDSGITGILTFAESGILLTIQRSDFSDLPPMDILYEFHEEVSDNNSPQTQAVPYIVHLQSPIPIFELPIYDIAYLFYTAEAGAYTIVEETYDESGNLWGRLKSGAGWIQLDNLH